MITRLPVDWSGCVGTCDRCVLRVLYVRYADDIWSEENAGLHGTVAVFTIIR